MHTSFMFRDMRFPILALVGFFLAAATSAQELHWTRTGISDQTLLRGPIQVLDDVDHDGWPDVLLLGEIWDPNKGDIDTAWILSGSTGATLHERRSPNIHSHFVAASPAGDWNGNGVVDYVLTVRAIPNDSAQIQVVAVCEGSSQEVLWCSPGSFSHVHGHAVLGDLNLDGDGRPDLLILSARETPFGTIRAHANDGRLLYRLDGTPDCDFSRSNPPALAKLYGDLDGDGCEDVVLGVQELTSRGSAAVLSGRTGYILTRGYGAMSFDFLGYSVDGCGDINLDGHLDFVASTPPLNGRLAYVCVFSGADGSVIHTWQTNSTGSRFGEVVSGSGMDFDLDGIPDVVISAPSEYGFVGTQTYSGAIYVFSGRDGARILHHTSRNGFFGTNLKTMPPMGGDPFPFYLATKLFGGSVRFGWQGAIESVRGKPPGTIAIGASCTAGSGPVPRIGLRPLDALGMRITLSDATPQTFSALMIGLSSTSWSGVPLPLSLDPFGLPGCELFTSIDASTTTTTGTTGLNAGFTAVDLMYPLQRGFLGNFSAFGQWISFSSTGAGVTNALSWVYR